MKLKEQKITIILLMAIVSLIPLLNGGLDNSIVLWISYLLLLDMVIISISYKKQLILSFNNSITHYYMFILWAGLSMFWTIHYVRTLIEFIQLLCYGLVFVLVNRLNEGDKIKVARIALITGVLIGGYGIVEYILIQSTRYSWNFINPNPLGIYFSILFLPTWGIYLRKANKWLYISSVILIISLILTGSRGSMLALILAMPFVYIGIDRKHLFKAMGKTILLIISTSILTGMIMIAAPYVQENLGLQGHLLKSLVRVDSFVSSSITGRLEFWRVALKLFANKPITGYGLGTFFQSYYLEYGGNEWYSRFTHNHYLQTASELGIIGLGLLLLFFLGCLFNIRGQIKKGNYSIYLPGVLAGIIAFMIHIGMDFSWNFPGVTVIFFALLGSVIKKNKENFHVPTIKISHKLKVGVLTCLMVIVLWHMTAQGMYNEAIKIQNQGDLEASKKIFKITNTLYPINSVGFSLESDNDYQLYYVEQKEEYLKEAITLAKKAITRAPYDSDLHYKLGILYYVSEDLDNAEKQLKLSASYGAYKLNTYIDLSMIYLNEKKYDMAEETLLKALELQPYALKSVDNEENKLKVLDETAKLNIMLANLYKNTGKKELSEQYLNNLKELAKDYPFVQKYLE